MGAVEKISRAYKRDKAVRVRQEAHKRNQFTLMPFRAFYPNETNSDSGKRPRGAKAMSEEMDSSFENEQILDAICCYMASNADAAEKQVVANDIAAKVIAMSQSADVILLAVAAETTADNMRCFILSRSKQELRMISLVSMRFV